MSANGHNTSEDTDMADCEGEKVVTMMDVLQEQQDFEDDANAVLGASDEKECTYSKGYIKRQAIYACLTCCTEAKEDPEKRAGVCLACSLNCHENHDLIELYTKRNFRCDCGNPKFGSHMCTYTEDKTEVNEDNSYNQNFSGLYCVCHRPYPDPDNPDEDEMIQCVVCEDWLHASHLEATVPTSEQFAEMVCKGCMHKNAFLNDYGSFAINNDESEYVDIVNGCENDASTTNGDVEHKVNGENEPSKDVVEKDVEMANAGEEKPPSDNVEKPRSTDVEQNETVGEVRNEAKDTEIKDIVDATEKCEEESTDKTADDDKEAVKPEIEDQKPAETEKSESAETTVTSQPDAEEKAKGQATPEENTTNEKDEISPTTPQKETTGDENAVTTQSENTADNKKFSDEDQKAGDENAETTQSENTADNKKFSDEDQKAGDENTETTQSENTADNKKFSDEDQKEIDAIDKFLEESDPKPESPKNENKEVEQSAGTEPENKDKVEVDGESEAMSTEKTEDTNKPEYNQEEAAPANEAKELETSTKVVETTEVVTTDVEMKEDAEAETEDNITVSEAESQTNGSPKATTEKRKRSTEESEVEDMESKKAKFQDDFGTCTRPKGPRKQFKGATFWPANFRQKLCTCSVCIDMYKDLSVLFLTDLDDTVTAYETLGKQRTPATQYEKGLQALSSLDRTVQINALTQYNDMKDRLLDFLKSFKDNQKIVKEEDIKAFFEGMKPKREPDGVYFCR